MSTAPAYLNLVHQLLTVCTAMGVEPVRASTPSTLPENKGYVFLRFGADDAAALIIPKSTAAVKMCDSHIEVPADLGGAPLKKPNGRVICHVDAARADWESVITLLMGAQKRAVARPSKGASAANTSLAEMTAKLQTLGKPAVQTPVASEPIPSDILDGEESGTFTTEA